MWVQFAQKDDSGIYFTLYEVASSHVASQRRLMLQAHSSGIQVSFFPDIQDAFLSFREYATLNDGQWHHVAFSFSYPNSFIYIDSQLVGTAVASSSPKSIIRSANYLGRSNWHFTTYQDQDTILCLRGDLAGVTPKPLGPKNRIFKMYVNDI